MPEKNVFIAGLSSDIGSELAGLYRKAGKRVFGTYRKKIQIEGLDESQMLFLDFSEELDAKDIRNFLSSHGSIDIAIFSIGVLNPIGPFFETPFKNWEKSFSVNSLKQIELMHIIREFLSPSATVIFFNGGAPNGVLPLYSAYSMGKIALTKMIEYLDSEDPSIKYLILGTGWVNTKIHRQTVDAKELAGGNFQRTQEFIQNPEKGTEIIEIFNCINWLDSQQKEIVSGRNFSVVWDQWRPPRESSILLHELSSDTNMYKLRRYKNEFKAN